MDRQLTTQQAAERAGVGPTAIKRWADDGLLACVRTAGGHRRFEEQVLNAFLRAQSPHAGDAPTDAARFVDQLLAAETGHAVEAALLELRGRAGSWIAVASFLAAVLEELGARWERGRLTILEEHLASDRLLRALGRVAEAIPVAPRAPQALLATVEGDDHLLGLALVELCLREAGLRTRWAGRATPLAEVTRALSEAPPALVAISASSASSDRRGLERYARKLGAACQAHRVKLLLGGAGAWPASPQGGTRLRTFEELRAYLAGRLE